MPVNQLKNKAFFKLVSLFSPWRSPITDHRIPALRTLAALLITALVLIAVAANVSHADTKKFRASEYQIKAAYLYNFLLFTHWPILMNGTEPGPGSKAVIIGIVGQDPFGAFFNEVEGRTIKMVDGVKKITIKRFGPCSNSLDLSNCHLLFISASEEPHMNKILAKAQGAPILTVGDIDNFLESGGMIRLVKVKDKIRWEINRGPVASAELRLDSMLLNSAAKVINK